LVGIHVPRELLEPDEPVPIELLSPAGNGKRAVALPPHGIQAGALVTDRSLHVGVDDVLAGALPGPHGLAELLEASRTGHPQHRGRLDGVLVARPPERVGLVDSSLDDHRVRPPYQVRVQERAVAGLPNLQDLRLVAAPKEDLLALDGQRLPLALVQCRATVLREPLDVDILRVPPP